MTHRFNLIAFLQKFFFDPQRMDPLVICRIVFGLSLAAHYLTLAPHTSEIFGPSGIGGLVFHQHLPNAISLARPHFAFLQMLSLFSSEIVVKVALGILILSSVFFTLGFCTQLSGWTALILHTLFHARNEYAFWGWGDMIRPFLLYVLFAPSGRWYSIDGWLRAKSFFPTCENFSSCGWPLRLLQIHVCTNYLVVGWARIDDPNWLEGSMLYGILVDSRFGRFDQVWRTLIPAIKMAGFISWGVEMLAPLGLWLRKTRYLFVFALISIHVGLEALTMVGYWNFIMIGGLTAFLKLPLGGLGWPIKWSRRQSFAPSPKGPLTAESILNSSSSRSPKI